MSQTLKICFLKRSFESKGGLEKQAKLIVDHFASLGHDITLVTEEAPFEIPYRVLKTKKSPSMSFLKVLNFNHASKLLLKNHSFDVIFSFDRTEDQTIMRLGNGVHLAYLKQKIRYEPWYKKLFPRNLQDLAILKIEKQGFYSPRLKAVIANSHMVKSELLYHYPIDANKIHVIHNGVEWKANQKLFDAQFSLDPSMMPFDYDQKKVQFLFVGHGFKRKGLAFLLQALSNIDRNAYELHIVGEDHKSDQFKRLAHLLKIEKNVFFHGKVPYTKQFFQIADCTIIPSIYDPFANVTVEALSLGCPIITSVHNGGHEILEPYMGSKLEELADITTFTTILNRHLIKKEADLAMKIRKGVEYLDFDHQLKKLSQLCLI